VNIRRVKVQASEKQGKNQFTYAIYEVHFAITRQAIYPLNKLFSIAGKTFSWDILSGGSTWDGILITITSMFFFAGE
jgi:hypothetical protein